jgi:hypothetical protein
MSRPATGRRFAAALAASVALLGANRDPGEAIAVRFPEGITHGFLTVSTLDGKKLGDGDVIQTAHGDQVTNRTVLQFKDGSVQEETVVYSQRGRFQVVSDHLIQKGPAFPRPLELSVDVPKGLVTVRYTEDGAAKVVTEHMELPPDLANGIVPNVIKNSVGSAVTVVSIVVAGPKPRLVKLRIAPAGEEPFSVGTLSKKAVKYVVHVELGGAAGVVAPLVGKQPQDTFVWVLGGDAPTFVKSEGPFFADGPSWRQEFASPTWPSAGAP